jgi:hypothetical protein
MEAGYTWVCDRLDEIKDECKLGSVYDVFETNKVRDDILVIFGVGMLYYECENGGFSQYVLNKNDVYKITIDALSKVGAVKTCKIVEKAMKYFFKHQGKSGSDSDLADISEDEAYDNFEEQFEDYLEMAINYLREKCLN